MAASAATGGRESSATAPSLITPESTVRKVRRRFEGVQQGLEGSEIFYQVRNKFSENHQASNNLMQVSLQVGNEFTQKTIAV